MTPAAARKMILLCARQAPLLWMTSGRLPTLDP
jgi:hypothetical protein